MNRSLCLVLIRVGRSRIKSLINSSYVSLNSFGLFSAIVSSISTLYLSLHLGVVYTQLSKLKLTVNLLGRLNSQCSRFLSTIISGLIVFNNSITLVCKPLVINCNIALSMKSKCLEILSFLGTFNR